MARGETHFVYAGDHPCPHAFDVEKPRFANRLDLVTCWWCRRWASHPRRVNFMNGLIANQVGPVHYVSFSKVDGKNAFAVYAAEPSNGVAPIAYDTCDPTDLDARLKAFEPYRVEDPAHVIQWRKVRAAKTRNARAPKVGTGAPTSARHLFHAGWKYGLDPSVAFGEPGWPRHTQRWHVCAHRVIRETKAKLFVVKRCDADADHGKVLHGVFVPHASVAVDKLKLAAGTARLYGVGTWHTTETTEPTSDGQRTTWMVVLGLNWPCTSKDIRAAWKRAARARHPDSGGSTQAFIEAKRAYDAGMRAVH